MPEVDYSYRVRVGPHTWTAAMGDTADYGPADGLQIIRKLRDSDLWPAPEEPAECRFQLVVASTADVPGVQLGAAVSVEYMTPAGGAIRQAFYGRVAELTSSPHDLGVVLQVNCLDYTADLREPTIGGNAAYPAEDVWARCQRIMTEAGYNLTVQQFPPGSGIVPVDLPPLALRDAEAANLWELLDSYLQQWPADYGYPVTSSSYYGRARMEVVPVIVADELSGFQLRPRFERPSYTGPLRLELVGGVWTLVPASGSGVVLVDAGEVDFSATYAQTKLDSPTRVTVSGDKFAAGEASVTADLGVVPPVNATIDSVQLTDLSDATVLAGMYVTDHIPVSRWVADEFLRHVELAPANATINPLGTVVTVGGLDATQNPNQRSWYTGQLAAYTFSIQNKRPTVAFQLRRPDFAVPNVGVITWGSVALVGTATWATLNPADTWDDYRLTRGTTT